MIVRHFLAWSRRANAAQRAEGAGALARAYLYSDLDDAERSEAEVAMMSLLDDPSPLVRRAVADNLASAAAAPHALILSLANDQSDIAAPVLSRSPLLTDADLIDCAAIGDAFAQSAIALRARVPSAVCAAIAEIGVRDAAIALAVNPGAEVPEFALRRMIARFGDDGEMREALLARPCLPATVRNELVAATTAALSAFAVDCGWLSTERVERLTREERDKANVMIAAETADREDHQSLRDLVAHLCASGQLTTSLLLRALLSGDRALLVTALAELTGLGDARIDGMTRDYRGAGFAALYRRAGLPEKYFVAFHAALAAQRDLEVDEETDARLSQRLIERALAACEAERVEDLGLIALLRRFEREAAREAARRETARLEAEETAAPVMFSGVSAASPLIDLAAFEAEVLAAA
jgi:uncharacterized protein (DUF2336 family)